mmetsp:Transcript_52325/g.147308  ORF Transcript_52325/g.147308 Transcript_52325/m.147308 type:complete len:403 (-) Transcript_52325:1557-2765(-)
MYRQRHIALHHCIIQWCDHLLYGPGVYSEADLLVDDAAVGNQSAIVFRLHITVDGVSDPITHVTNRFQAYACAPANGGVILRQQAHPDPLYHEVLRLGEGGCRLRLPTVALPLAPLVQRGEAPPRGFAWGLCAAVDPAPAVRDHLRLGERLERHDVAPVEGPMRLRRIWGVAAVAAVAGAAIGRLGAARAVPVLDQPVAEVVNPSAAVPVGCRAHEVAVDGVQRDDGAAVYGRPSPVDVELRLEVPGITVAVAPAVLVHREVLPGGDRLQPDGVAQVAGHVFALGVDQHELRGLIRGIPLERGTLGVHTQDAPLGVADADLVPHLQAATLALLWVHALERPLGTRVEGVAVAVAEAVRAGSHVAALEARAERHPLPGLDGRPERGKLRHLQLRQLRREPRHR